MNTIEKAIGRLGAAKKTEAQVPVDVPVQVEGDLNLGQTALHSAKGDEKKTSKNRISLDLARLERMGFLTPESGRGQLTEEIRHIKRPLLLNAFQKGISHGDSSNLIMVTSARPGEGKTFTSVNLAMSIAKERGKTVLLVDADVAKPNVSRTLGLPSKLPGLVDYLSDDSLTLADTMLKTNVPNLRVLTSGRTHIHSTELLASEAMRLLVEELSQRYSDRVVIFDSPPMLATTEAAVLAGLVGQIVVVVEAEKTTKQEINEAVGMLDQSKMIGLVLNKARTMFTSDYYGYYGYYGSSGE
jgi:exopolysaccharide/PEP-CTERM locus tyrosine autokinase